MGFARVIMQKAFKKKAVKAVLCSREILVTENGFSLKQAKFRLDRQSHRYWKETKPGERLWPQAFWTGQGGTPGLGLK